MRKMNMNNKLRGHWKVVGSALVVCLALLSGVARADFERQFSFDSAELRLANLIGAVEVRSTSGNSFTVTVRVHGEDASTERVTFEESGGRRSELAVLFPVDEADRYVYPPLGRNSRTKFSSRNHDNLLGQLLGLGRDQIEVRGRPFRGALEIWADVVVEVPEGKRLSVFLGVGATDADDVTSDLELNSQAGHIEARNIRGDLKCDTGSGRIEARGVNGDVDVNTGSGSVEVADVQDAQFVRIDSGSGSVVVERITANRLSIDTGSGSVDVDGANVEDLAIDTGSGGVEAYEISCDDASIDTGSGGVRFELVRMGSGRYDIDTGSGGIRLHLPNEISASFQADTGSGGISVDIEGVTLTRRQERDGEASFTVGGGASRFRLSTGSGTIRIVQSRRG
jgi:hypothetical protein